jgi:hypothetical protein
MLVKGPVWPLLASFLIPCSRTPGLSRELLASRLQAFVRLSLDNVCGLYHLRCASWGTGYYLTVFCDLLRLEKLPQRLYVILELGGKRLADFVDFFDNGVLPHRLALKFFWGTDNRRDVARVATDLFDAVP